MGNSINIQKDLEQPKDLLEATYDTSEYSLNGINMYGKVVNVYDGDTVNIVFKVNNTLIKYNCRLSGIDSPELCPKNIKDPKKKEQEIKCATDTRNYLINRVSGQKIEGIVSKNDIKELCGRAQKLVWVKCYDFDKYGRLLVEIFENNNTDTISINQEMINNKMVIAYDGGKKSDFDVTNFT